MPYSMERRGPRRHRVPHRHRRSDERYTAASSERFNDGGRSYGVQGSWVDGPDYPAPSAATLHRLQDKGAAPRSYPPRLDLEEAFGLAHEALEKSKVTTVPCINKSPRREIYYWKYDLPFMVFDDLDRKLFRSVLQGNVYLTWASLPRGVDARTSRAGLRGRPRITIELSHDIAEGRAATLGILLHQMIHAYYLQCCGHKNRGVDGKGHDLCHKEEFHNLRRSIREHFLPGESSVWEAANDLSPGLSRKHLRSYVPEAGSSDCYCRSPQAKKKSVNRWRMYALALAIAKSARRAANDRGSDGSSEDGGNQSAQSNYERFYSIERDGSSMKNTAQSHCPFTPGTYIILQYGKGLYPIRKQQFHDREALSKSPFFSNDKLVFPSTSSLDDFGILVSYLKESDFAPTRASALTASTNALPYGSSLNIIATQGPPIILPPIANSPQYLASSISAYRLATTLQFEPLKNAAINRLYGISCTSEDPIALLEQIYKPKLAMPQEDKLRAWVRNWLSRAIDSSFSSQYATAYPTNLHLLQRHPDHGAKFHRLAQTNSALARDVSAVGEAVAKLQTPAGIPRDQNIWGPGFLPQLAYSPFLNPSPSPNESPYNQWPYQHLPTSLHDELYRHQQEQEAAQRQYMLDAERGALPRREVDHEISAPLRQYYDPSVEARMKYLQMRDRGLPFL